MLTLAFPWLLLLLPLPLLVRALVPAYTSEKESVRAPFLDEMAGVIGRRPTRGAVILRQNIGQRILLPLVWALLVLAAARPQWVGTPIEQIE